MKQIHYLIVGVLSLALSMSVFNSTAHAWEFEMSGAFNWSYEWYNQTGTKGFFGRYNADNSGGATRVANLNFWNGGQFDTNLTSSADAGWSYFNVEFLPQIKINEAIRFKGKYRLGTYGDPVASDYHTEDAPGTNRAFSEGQWTMFWVTASTPWGVVGIGKRPWTFGAGLQYDGEDAASTESISLTAPYGPLDIGIAFHPYRYAGTSSIEAYADDNPYNNFPEQYFSRADRSGSFSKDFLGFIMYHNGAVRAGVIGSYGGYHIGPEAQLIPDPANPPTPSAPLDSDLFHGTTFMKYNNGRFFFNAEAAWLYWTDRWSGIPADGVPNPRYVEQWRYMAEMGLLMGPAKLSLLHAWTPGPDRRGSGDGVTSVLIGKQPAAFVRHGNFDRQLGNYDVFRPYSYLFAYAYGAGLNAYNLSGDGYLRDASVLAARLDYAVAANLNVYGSFFYAERTANGYSWGCIGPNAGAAVGTFTTPTDGNLDFNLNRYPTSPNIPDTALGYEIDAGLDWKLLENWNMGIIFGYWQPGKWFGYACVDRSVPGWHDGSAANNYGTLPGKKIDPIIGGSFNLTFDY